MNSKGVQHSSWIQWLINGSCGVFIFVLALAAVYDPTIRLLHLFEAGIYVSVVIWARRDSAWGYGAGCFIAAFWNWTNLVHTTFIANGLREVSRLVQTGQVRRPDQLIAVLAATAHFVLIVSCVLGYLQIRPKVSWNPLMFLGGGFMAIAYFAAIVMLFGRQYIPLLRQVFGI